MRRAYTVTSVLAGTSASLTLKKLVHLPTLLLESTIVRERERGGDVAAGRLSASTQIRKDTAAIFLLGF
jgi:hypothetical protein